MSGREPTSVRPPTSPTTYAPLAAPAGNDIPRRQNAPEMLALLRAKSALYVWQFRLGAVAPVLLASLAVAAPAVGRFAGAAGVVLLLLDLGWLDRGQRNRTARAAVMQEFFDCSLLGLPWREDRVGPQPMIEEIDGWARRHPSTEHLVDWYPAVAGSLPADHARVLCQRVNGGWDGAMRRRWAEFVVKASIAVLGVVAAVACVRGASVFDALLDLAALSAGIQWASREATQQRDAAASGDAVAARAAKLWSRPLQGRSSPTVVAQESRELQNDIYDRRRTDRQVFPWVYERFRTRDEETMRTVATRLVAEYQDRAAASDVA